MRRILGCPAFALIAAPAFALIAALAGAEAQGGSAGSSFFGVGLGSVRSDFFRAYRTGASLGGIGVTVRIVRHALHRQPRLRLGGEAVAFTVLDGESSSGCNQTTCFGGSSAPITGYQIGPVASLQVVERQRYVVLMEAGTGMLFFLNVLRDAEVCTSRPFSFEQDCTVHKKPGLELGSSGRLIVSRRFSESVAMEPYAQVVRGWGRSGASSLSFGIAVTYWPAR